MQKAVFLEYDFNLAKICNLGVTGFFLEGGASWQRGAHPNPSSW